MNTMFVGVFPAWWIDRAAVHADDRALKKIKPLGAGRAAGGEEDPEKYLWGAKEGSQSTVKWCQNSMCWID